MAGVWTNIVSASFILVITLIVVSPSICVILVILVCRDTGNDFFVPRISGGSVPFPGTLNVG